MIDRKYLALQEEEALKSGAKVFLKDEMTGLWYGLPEGTHVVGRMDDEPIDIPILTKDEYMSRKAMKVFVEKDLLGRMEVKVAAYKREGNPCFLNELLMDIFPLMAVNGCEIILGKSMFRIIFLNNN